MGVAGRLQGHRVEVCDEREADVGGLWPGPRLDGPGTGPGPGVLVPRLRGQEHLAPDGRDVRELGRMTRYRHTWLLAVRYPHLAPSSSLRNFYEFLKCGRARGRVRLADG